VLTFAAICLVGALLVGGFWIWRTTMESGASDWFEYVVRPVLTPPVTLSLRRLQRRAVATALSQVQVTSFGRGALRSPVALYFSVGDFSRVEPLGDFIKPEIADDLVAKANKLDWDVADHLIVELVCDTAIADGRPRAEIGRPVRSSGRQLSASYSLRPRRSPIGPRWLIP
jgi:hypothetical protein